MKNKTKSLLESLVEISPSKDSSLIIESRGSHIIASAIALLETINFCYGEEKASEMEKRLLSSIRYKNLGKFARGVRTLEESKNVNRSTINTNTIQK
jgi:hypothetical protein